MSDHEPVLCSLCRGCGEGQYEGTVCPQCHGSGECLSEADAAGDREDRADYENDMRREREIDALWESEQKGNYHAP